MQDDLGMIADEEAGYARSLKVNPSMIEYIFSFRFRLHWYNS